MATGGVTALLHIQVWRCGGASIRAQGGGWCKRMAGQRQSSGKTWAEAAGAVVPTRGACPGGANSTGLSLTLDALFRSSPESRKTLCLNKEDEASQAWKRNIQSSLSSYPPRPPPTPAEGKAVWGDNRKGAEVAQVRRGDVSCRHSNAHLSHWSGDSRTGVFTEAPALRGRSSAESWPAKLPTASAKNTPDIIISLTSTT